MLRCGGICPLLAASMKINAVYSSNKCTPKLYQNFMKPELISSTYSGAAF